MDDARECLARLRERAPGVNLAGVERILRATMDADPALLAEFVDLLRRAGLE
jgi:hypothetical protein